MARPYGWPVERSQATTVSRWLVMPIAATDAAPTCSTTSCSVARAASQISAGVVLDPTGPREVLGELAVRRRRRADPSVNTARLRMPVVPASMAMTHVTGASPFDGAAVRTARRAARRRRAGAGPRRTSVGGVADDGDGAWRAQLGERLALVAELGQHVAEPEVQRAADEQAAEDRHEQPSPRKNRANTTAMIPA